MATLSLIENMADGETGGLTLWCSPTWSPICTNPISDQISVRTSCSIRRLLLAGLRGSRVLEEATEEVTGPFESPRPVRRPPALLLRDMVLDSKYNVTTVRLLMAGEWSSVSFHTVSTTSFSALDSFFDLQQN